MTLSLQVSYPCHYPRHLGFPKPKILMPLLKLSKVSDVFCEASGNVDPCLHYAVSWVRRGSSTVRPCNTEDHIHSFIDNMLAMLQHLCFTPLICCMETQISP